MPAPTTPAAGVVTARERETSPGETLAHERALDIASRTLVILAAQSALAAAALREMSEALGSRTKRGIVAEADGRFRVYSNGASCGGFSTFDAALEELLRHLTSGGSR